MSIESIIFGIKEVVFSGVIIVICTAIGGVIGSYLDNPLIGGAVGFIVGAILSAFLVLIGLI